MYSANYGYARHPPPRHYTPQPYYQSKFQRSRGLVLLTQSHTSHNRSYDALPRYSGGRHYADTKELDYPNERFGPGRRPSYPVPLYQNSSHSRNHSNERAFVYPPKPHPHLPYSQPMGLKTDLEKEAKRRIAQTSFRPMFKHFQYPSHVPMIPERIHRGQMRRGRVNTTVSETEMRPSYTSHQTSRMLTPESLSSSEEEVLFRASEDSGEPSEPPSINESNYASASEGEPEDYERSPLPPYQAVEEDHYKRHDDSFRSVPSKHQSSVRTPSSQSNKSVEVQVTEKKKKKRRIKKRKEHSPSDGSLSPLLEEEEVKPRKTQKAKVPPSFPPKKQPYVGFSPPQYIPQPIIYQMPQPYPMPYPMYTPQYYPQQPAYFPPMKEPEQVQPYRRERATQYTEITLKEEKTLSREVSSSAFETFGTDFDRRISPKRDAGTGTDTDREVKYRQPVALEIGMVEGKSLAERFQEKLPEVSAKITSRQTGKQRLEHKDKSATQLLEIRKELLKPSSATPRVSSNSRGSSEPRKETPTRKLDPVQVEQSDRLAAGLPAKVSKKESSERAAKAYEQLPEVRQKKAEEEKKESQKKRLQVKKEQDAVINKSRSPRQVAGMPVKIQ